MRLKIPAGELAAAGNPVQHPRWQGSCLPSLVFRAFTLASNPRKMCPGGIEEIAEVAGRHLPAISSERLTAKLGFLWRCPITPDRVKHQAGLDRSQQLAQFAATCDRTKLCSSVLYIVRGGSAPDNKRHRIRAGEWRQRTWHARRLHVLQPCWTRLLPLPDGKLPVFCSHGLGSAFLTLVPSQDMAGHQASSQGSIRKIISKIDIFLCLSPNTEGQASLTFFRGEPLAVSGETSRPMTLSNSWDILPMNFLLPSSSVRRLELSFPFPYRSHSHHSPRPTMRVHPDGVYGPSWRRSQASASSTSSFARTSTSASTLPRISQIQGHTHTRARARRRTT